MESQSEVTVPAPVYDLTSDHPLGFTIKPMNLNCDLESRKPIGDFGGVIKYEGLQEESFIATHIEQLSVADRKYQPTAFTSGYCEFKNRNGELSNCRFWAMYVDNRETDSKDIMTLMLYTKTGDLFFHVTGSVAEGKIVIE